MSLDNIPSPDLNVRIADSVGSVLTRSTVTEQEIEENARKNIARASDTRTASVVYQLYHAAMGNRYLHSLTNNLIVSSRYSRNTTWILQPLREVKKSADQQLYWSLKAGIPKFKNNGAISGAINTFSQFEENVYILARLINIRGIDNTISMLTKNNFTLQDWICNATTYFSVADYPRIIDTESKLYYDLIKALKKGISDTTRPYSFVNMYFRRNIKFMNLPDEIWLKILDLDGIRRIDEFLLPSIRGLGDLVDKSIQDKHELFSTNTSERIQKYPYILSARLNAITMRDDLVSLRNITQRYIRKDISKTDRASQIIVKE